MKRIAATLLITVLLCVLSACQTEAAPSTVPTTVPAEPTTPFTEVHVHTWQEASCTEARTCTICGAEDGEPKGHTWQAANCEEAIACVVCGASDGAPKGHVWESPTCTEPEKCTICGRILGAALGHHYEDDTCVRCGENRKIIMPIAGKILRDYCVDALGYNPTTKDWRIHSGIDIAASMGTPVHAVTDGVVERTYVDPTMGVTVIIAHPGDYATFYYGLQSGFAVSQGEAVSSGQIIGYVGNTNDMEAADEPHLHFEVTYKGAKVDPLSYINEKNHVRHEWQNATCETAETCSICGKTQGEPLGHGYVDGVCIRCGELEEKPVEHVWQAATCTTPKTCRICGLTEGEAKGHKWQGGSCTKPQTCSVCGVSDGEAKGHRWQGGSCTEPRTCSVCGVSDGAAKGHAWQEATCTTPKTCMNCQVTEGEASGHIWIPVTCYLVECQTCGATEAVEDGHNWKYESCTTMCCYSCGAVKEVEGEHAWAEATCLHPRICAWCGEIDGDPEARGEHRWEAATCTAPKTCTLCGTTEGAPGNHVLQTIPGVAATCTEGGLSEGVRCSVCYMVVRAQTETSPLGHNWLPATYTSPKTCSRCGATTGGLAEKRPIEIQEPHLPYTKWSGCAYMVSLCAYSTYDNGNGTYRVEVKLYFTNISDTTFVSGVWCTLSGIEPDRGTAHTLAPGQSAWCTVVFVNVPGGHYRIMLQ